MGRRRRIEWLLRLDSDANLVLQAMTMTVGMCGNGNNVIVSFYHSVLSRPYSHSKNVKEWQVGYLRIKSYPFRRVIQESKKYPKPTNPRV